MALKLDQIVSHVEEVHFKIPQTNRQPHIELSKNNISNLILLPTTNYENENNKVI